MFQFINVLIITSESRANLVLRKEGKKGGEERGGKKGGEERGGGRAVNLGH